MALALTVVALGGVVTRPTAGFVLLTSVNQTLPSGPAAMPDGLLPELSPVPKSRMSPVVDTRPMAPAVPWSANQSAPSAPAVMSRGEEPRLSPELNSVMLPAVDIRPMAGVVPRSVNQRFPSGPGVIWAGALPGLRPVLK